MGKVIINSDDFGYSRGVNYGIADAYQKGILTSTTLMANMSGFDHAVQLKKELPGLGVGVHLNATCGKPLLSKVETLKEKENFKHLSFYQKKFVIDLDELYEEWDAQIQKVFQAGIDPTHIDSHHHTHTFNQNQKVVVALAKKYDLPVRGNFELANKIRHTENFEPFFDDVGVEESENRQIKQPLVHYLNNLLDQLRKTKSTEIMCHTAYLDQKLLTSSSFVFPRVNQVEFLINSNFAKQVKEDHKIELCTYRDIQ